MESPEQRKNWLTQSPFDGNVEHVHSTHRFRERTQFVRTQCPSLPKQSAHASVYVTTRFMQLVTQASSSLHLFPQ